MSNIGYLFGQLGQHMARGEKKMCKKDLSLDGINYKQANWEGTCGVFGMSGTGMTRRIFIAA